MISPVEKKKTKQWYFVSYLKPLHSGYFVLKLYVNTHGIPSFK